MAVRYFDNSESGFASVLEAAPLTRREVRRSRQNAATRALVALGTPFVLAVIVLGVLH
jgi:hypothetical protein